MSSTEPAIISHAFKNPLKLNSIKDGVLMRFRFADEAMMKRSLEYIRKNDNTKSLSIISGLTGDLESIEDVECIFASIKLYIGQDHYDDTISFHIDTGLDNIFSSENFPVSKFYDKDFMWSFEQDKDSQDKDRQDKVGKVSVKIKYGINGTQRNIDPFPYYDDWRKFVLGGYSVINHNSSATNLKNEKNIEFTQSSDKHQNTSPMPSNMWLIACEEVKIGDDSKKIEWAINNGVDSALRYEQYSDLFRLEMNTADS